MFPGGSLNKSTRTTQTVMKEREHWRLGGACFARHWHGVSRLWFYSPGRPPSRYVQRDEMRNWRAKHLRQNPLLEPF